jgi:Papain-like cysteine protease AvrRpt2
VSLIDDSRIPLSRVEGTRGFPLVATAAPAEPAWKRLNLTMQHQLQDNWCWAAVSTSVAHFFGNTTWTQCVVVSKEVDDGACCTDGSSKKCNVPWRLDNALRRVKVLKKKSNGMPGKLDGVRGELDAGRPVCIRIGWSGGGGHFIAIEGYRDDSGSVAIEDPWHGTSDVPISVFRAGRYQGTGSWTHTYYTEKP